MLKTGRRGFMKWAGAVVLTLAIDPKFGSELGSGTPKVTTRPDRKGDDDLVMHLIKNRTWGDDFTKMEFPVVRRVFPSLIASEIVSVQPMSVPAGSVFFAEYSYRKAKEADYIVSITPIRPWWKRWLRVG